ncbi:hypothetical protein ACJJTC_000035, partial [Scirpophaga incertulas]
QLKVVSNKERLRRVYSSSESEEEAVRRRETTPIPAVHAPDGLLSPPSPPSPPSPRPQPPTPHPPTPLLDRLYSDSEEEREYQERRRRNTEYMEQIEREFIEEQRKQLEGTDTDLPPEKPPDESPPEPKVEEVRSPVKNHVKSPDKRESKPTEVEEGEISTEDEPIDQLKECRLKKTDKRQRIISTSDQDHSNNEGAVSVNGVKETGSQSETWSPVSQTSQASQASQVALDHSYCRPPPAADPRRADHLQHDHGQSPTSGDVVPSVAGYTWMAEHKSEKPTEETKPKKETKRPYKRKHESKKLAEIQNNVCSTSSCVRFVE